MDGGIRMVAAILSQLGIPPTMDNFIDIIFYKTSLYAGHCSGFHHYRDHFNNTCLVFEHQYGIKWSRSLGNSICRVFKKQFNVRTDLISSDRIIKIIVHPSTPNQEIDEVIRDPYEIQKLALDLINKAEEQILMIFFTPNALNRQIKAGLLQSLEKAVSIFVKIRAIVPAAAALDDNHNNTMTIVSEEDLEVAFVPLHICLCPHMALAYYN